ncbi:MAG: DUF4087 domain-containing protein [Sphingobium sp.]
MGFKRWMWAGVLLLAGSTAATAEPAAERRCGWLMNETPGNWDLIDRDGRWTLGVQGGYQAPGLDDLPDMSTAGWIDSNGAHGYGCACLSLVTDKVARKVRAIRSGGPIPLARCKSDKALPKP